MFKKLISSILPLVAFLFLNFSVEAQGFDNIANAFKAGNSSELATHFDNNVEITIKSGANSYSKSQAEMVLKNFFTTHTPKSFAIAHQGTSPEGSKYFIGNLATSSGNFRAYVYAKTVNKVLVIQEIRIEEQQ
jgi:hypothetical protein